ncbi:MAG TPA: MBOAT family O-acyltransferase [Verrucomicrobiae bacterium]|jgi:D-alanyl-lipoteichoic acid acyltransferase DltB (MBOAT superfamily)
MLFSSWEFILLFLPLAILVFFLIPSRPLWLRKVWLFAASLFFYGYWKIEYVPLLLLSIAFNYSVAELLTRCAGHRKARWICVAGVSANLLLLGYFKYTNFLGQLVNFLTSGNGPRRFDIILPLAISFFTFTQIGYIVDVYRKQSLHYRFLDYAVFVIFFPHLIAGPIVRHWEVIPQFAERPMRPDAADARVGLALFLIGLYKKIFLADPFSQYVETVFHAAGGGGVVPWFDSWLALIAFALQIYFDFSGYSDMAIGLARIFGVRFPINFNSPYQAGSVNEFWSRWHITLTRFLREYLYFPLGGNRCGPWRHSLNIMVTMLLSGLWHGAGWTYVIWGGLHGCYLVISHRWQKFKERRWPSDGAGYRFATKALTLMAVLIAWVFFRAPNFATATNFLSCMSGGHGLTMSMDTTNPARFPGSLIAKCGVHFVPPSFQVESYDSLFKLTLVALMGALFFPNSQELLAAYEPALEAVKKQRWFQLRLEWKGGLLLGALFFWILKTYYTATPSPFLYFNF